MNRLPILRCLLLSLALLPAVGSPQTKGNLNSSCAMLNPQQLTQLLGGTYNVPQAENVFLVNPSSKRPHSVQGTICEYRPSCGSGVAVTLVLLEDESAATAKQNFDFEKSRVTNPQRESGLGDEAYTDNYHVTRVLQGRRRWQIGLSKSGDFTVEMKKQTHALAVFVTQHL